MLYSTTKWVTGIICTCSKILVLHIPIITWLQILVPFKLLACSPLLYLRLLPALSLFQSFAQLPTLSGGQILVDWFTISCHKVVSHKCIIIAPRTHLLSICCSIFYIALLLSSQQHSLTMEALVSSEWGGELPDFSRPFWAKQLATSFPHANSHTASACPFKWVCCSPVLTRTQRWCTEFSVLHKNCKTWGGHFALQGCSKFYLCILWFDCSSHILDKKGISDKKFKSNQQTFSPGGHSQLGMTLG